MNLPAFIRVLRFVAFVALIVAFATLSPALPPVSADIDGWTSLGPPGGGVLSIEFDPADPSRVYAGTERGVYKSTDGGVSWSAANAGMAGEDIRSIAVSPSDHDVIYAIPERTADQTAIFASHDRGQTWAEVRIPENYVSAGGLAIDPKNPNKAYVGFSTGGGLWITTDGGKSWQKRIDNKTIMAVAVDPIHPDTVYAAGSAVFKSTDGGATWGWSSSGITNLQFSLAIDPQNPAVLYVAAALDGIYKTIDGGKHWLPARTGMPAGNLYTTSVVLSASNPGTLYAHMDNGRGYKSIDGAVSWVEIAPLPQENGYSRSMWAFAVNPQNPDVALGSVAGLDGPYRTANGGSSWAISNSGIFNGASNSFAVDPTDARVLYVARWNIEFQLMKSTDGGMVWETAAHGGDELTRFAIDPVRPDHVFALRSYKEAVSRSTDGGKHWEDASPAGVRVNDVVFGAHSETLYLATTCGVYRAQADHLAWLYAGTPGVGECLNVRRLMADPADSQTLYAWAGPNSGDPNSGLHRTRDGGASWTRLSGWWPRDITYWPTHPGGGIAFDFAHPGVVYEGRGAKVARSADWGATWGDGVAIGYANVTDIVVDTRSPSALYASTEGNGVHRSLDSGKSWNALNNGLTDKRVLQLVFDPAIPAPLYARTTGGGIFERREGEYPTATPTASVTPTATPTATPVAGSNVYLPVTMK